MQPERRHNTRKPLRLQLEVAGVGDAMCRDISATGLYLFLPPGSRLEGPVSLELSLAGSALKARARGEVVRVEPGWTRTGVALRLQDLQLLPLLDSAPAGTHTLLPTP